MSKESNLKNKEFDAFSDRFYQVLSDKSFKPYPLYFNDDELKMVFEEIHPVVLTSFYAEIEVIINVIKRAYAVVLEKSGDNENTIGNSVEAWFKDEENMNSFIQYIVCSYQSVPANRIASIYPKNFLYQEIEEALFNELIKGIGFEKTYQLHEKLVNSFHDKYKVGLFNGIIVKTDEDLESLVLVPAISDFEKVIQREREEMEVGVNE